MSTTWPEVALGEVAEIVSGATPKTSERSYWDGETCWVTPKDLSGLGVKHISDTTRKLTAAGLRSCSAAILPAGSVLLSSRAPIGLVAINTVPMATNQGFKSLVPDSGRIDASYLYWWLVTNRVRLQSLGRGATFAEISKAITARITLPLPPLPEQRRIAAILDAADELRTKRRASLALLDSLTESIFLDMFGDPAPARSSWPVEPLATVVEGFETGKSMDTADADSATATHRVVKVSAVTSGRYLPGETKPVPPTYVPPPRHLVRQGDLLFSRANTEALVGASALVEAEHPGHLLSDKIWRFAFRPQAPVSVVYVWQWLQAPDVRWAIGSLATGTSGSMKNISQAKLMTLPMPLPPYQRQLDFEARFSQVRIEQRRASVSEDQLDTLFASLQHRAFRGLL